MRSFRTLIAVAAVALLAASVGACSSKGKVKEPVQLTELENPAFDLFEVWGWSPGKGTGKTYAGLRLVVAADAAFGADTKGRVFALDPKTGERIWDTNTDARLISGPGVSGGLVLLGSLDAEVVALKRSDGMPAWRVTLSSEVLAPPVGAGNVIVARCVDGKVFGLSAVDGKQLWSFDRNVPPLTLRGLSAPLILHNLVITGMDNGRVVALRLADGQPVWEQVIAVPTGRSELERITDIDADLLPAENGLYAASYGGEVAAVSATDGDVAWRRSVRSYSGMVLVGNLLVVTDDDGVVWALDARTGAAAWKQEGLKYRRLSAPADYKGYVVVGDYKGYVHMLSASDGQIVAQERLSFDAIAAAPMVQDGLLYVFSAGGRIAATEALPREETVQ